MKIKHTTIKFSNNCSVAVLDRKPQDQTCHDCDRLTRCYQNIDTMWRCPKCTLQAAKLTAMKRDLRFGAAAKKVQIRHRISAASLQSMRSLYRILKFQEDSRRCDPAVRLAYGESTPMMRQNAAGWQRALKVLANQ